MHRRLLVAAIAAGLVLATVRTAYAGGLEYTGQGARALGRGGAVAARADDPMVLAHNPAGLAELRGSQFLVELNLALFDACVDPAGYYGWGLYIGGQNSRLTDPKSGDTRMLHLSDPEAARETYYTDPLDTVCLEQTVVPVPQVVWTRRVSERLGIGFGFIFPAVQPGGRWGGKNGLIRGDTGELRPAATRYMMLQSNNLGLFPTVGFGFRVLDRLRLGAAFEWGIIGVNNLSMSSSGGGTIPSADIIAHVKAQDWFIPAFTVSAHVVPIDAIDAVVAFRFQDDLKATGDLDVTTGVFNPGLKPTSTGSLEITRLRQNMPWKLRAGLRYADRFAPRPVGTGRDEADPASPDVVHDTLQDERWDIEADAEYQFNARNRDLALDYKPFQKLEFVSAVNGMSSFADAPVQTEIRKRWRNQISLRAGGTANIVPGLFSVSTGMHYENTGVDPSYMQVDFWPLQRVGIHGGITVRIAKSIDFTFSYAHIFQETLIVAPPAHQDRVQIAECWAGSAMDPSVCRAPKGEVGAIDKSTGPMLSRTAPPPLEAPSQGKSDGQAKLAQVLTVTAGGQPPWIINSGRYSSNFDIIAAGVNMHF